MQVMTPLPHAFGQNLCVRMFLDGLKAQYSPPALDTVAHFLTELATFVSDALRSVITVAKEHHAGVPFCHVVSDLWTEEHSHRSYGSFVPRLTELEAGTVQELSLGVWRCSGRRNHKIIRSWVANPLSFLVVELQDVSSATTDSGSNVRKAMMDCRGPGFPLQRTRSTTPFDTRGAALARRRRSGLPDSLPLASVPGTLERSAATRWLASSCDVRAAPSASLNTLPWRRWRYRRSSCPKTWRRATWRRTWSRAGGRLA